MPRQMSERPERLRVNSESRPIAVDREARVLRGYVVAQEGPFKSEGRGEFDATSLSQIVEQWPKEGLRSRFAHPSESSDGLGKFLGRAHSPFLSTATVERNGEQVTLAAVRADLHLSSSAFETNPNGNLGEYILSLAESDPGAISSSLVLKKNSEYRLNSDGTPACDADGRELPPLWRVEKLYASDIVDEGDAVDGVLSPQELGASDKRHWTREYLHAGEAMLNKMFAGLPRRVVQARCLAFLNRYLGRRYGDKQMGYSQLGASLAGVLENYITAAETEERTRDTILNEMAAESGLTVEQVTAIVEGSDEGVTTPVLEAFARVLECPLSELIAAAEEDGIDLAEPTPEPEPEAEPEPTTDTPPAAMSVAARRRRLALKAKGG